MNTPVVFLVFNRPDLTARVFAAIARAKPRQLLVVADGPRDGNSADVEKCRATRAIFEKKFDWPCDLQRNYAEHNIGCRQRVSTGLNWAFAMVPEAIILEDDCFPGLSFFPFCENLLERYRDEKSVMHIGGVNLVRDNQPVTPSYYFSHYAHVWGWASWRRAWQHYQPDMAAWPEWKEKKLLARFLGDHRAVGYWRRQFDRAWSGKIDTWDFPWLFTCWRLGGLAITPTRNLVSNLGFRGDGTHTVAFDSRTAELGVGEIERLVHPPAVQPDGEADRRSFEQLYYAEDKERRPFRRLIRSLIRVGRACRERSKSG